jgi:hypothetical protein
MRDTMKEAHAATPHDASPEVAIAAILQHGGTLLIDLDETLYLRNSTEDFIDCTHPRLPALLVLRALDVVKPWRWTGGEVTRDVWRVGLVFTCFPWTGRFWEERVAGLAGQFRNQALMTALHRSDTTPIIATSGFHRIVAPLVAALGLPNAPIIAARLSSFADRRDGKLSLTSQALSMETIGESLVLTDSAQDIPLLDACARPLRTIWPDAQYQDALANVYLPGQYLTYVKRPGARYIVRGILQEDFAFWILSSIALAAVPIAHVLGLFLLLVSFWAIYERGYVDNDLIAARLEGDPKLSPEFRRGHPVSTPIWQPWLWALGLGMAGIVILRYPGLPEPRDLGAWMAVLLGTHLWFYLYNRLDKESRVWMFAGLQFARSAAFVVLVPIVPVGAMALGAHVLAKWVPYYIYRLAGKDWPRAPFHLTRLLFFIVLAALLALTAGPGAIFGATGLALLAWNLYRARSELAAALGRARRLDRPAKTSQSSESSESAESSESSDSSGSSEPSSPSPPPN